MRAWLYHTKVSLHLLYAALVLHNTSNSCLENPYNQKTKYTNCNGTDCTSSMRLCHISMSLCGAQLQIPYLWNVLLNIHDKTLGKISDTIWLANLVLRRMSVYPWVLHARHQLHHKMPLQGAWCHPPLLCEPGSRLWACVWEGGLSYADKTYCNGL